MDDPDVEEAVEEHGELCRQLRFGLIDEETFAEKFRPTYVNVLLPLDEDIKEAGWLQWWWRSTQWSASKIVGRESAFLGAVLWTVNAVAFVMILIVWVVGHFWERVEDVSETIVAPLALVFGASIIGTLILLAGGFVPFLKVISLIIGIIGSMIGIALGLKKLFEDR